MPGASTLVSWEALGQSWDIGKHKNGHFEVQAWIFNDFSKFGVPISKVAWLPLSCLLPGSFLWYFLGLNPDVWDWEAKHLA